MLKPKHSAVTADFVGSESTGLPNYILTVLNTVGVNSSISHKNGRKVHQEF